MWAPLFWLRFVENLRIFHEKVLGAKVKGGAL